jgi:hypothetical protein
VRPQHRGAAGISRGTRMPPLWSEQGPPGEAVPRRGTASRGWVGGRARQMLHPAQRARKEVRGFATWLTASGWFIPIGSAPAPLSAERQFLRVRPNRTSMTPRARRANRPPVGHIEEVPRRRRARLGDASASYRDTKASETGSPLVASTVESCGWRATQWVAAANQS